MAIRNGWLSGPRSEILNMCRVWINYLTLERRTAWGIPAAEFTEMGTLFGAAQALLLKSRNEAERTHVITVEVQAAFKALDATMRFFRDRRFKIPPLSSGDWAALGFREKDDHPANIPPPTGTPSVFLSYPGGPYVLTAHPGPVKATEALNPAGDYGYAVYVGIMPQGGATPEEAASKKHYLMRPPKDGDELLHYRFTRRRKEQIVFDAEDAGKTAYVCARYENGKGETGLWGPMVSATIPQGK
ncbi:MAG: hypothetical protein LBS06_02735 [Treponema sp.]|jgi:hypothetical protein|nr:hypothetical protein [Treponema sp.]